MKRTMINVPADLHAWAKGRALERGVSLSEIVREALAAARARGSTGRRGRDPLFRPVPMPSDVEGGPRDGSLDIDKYVYDDGDA